MVAALAVLISHSLPLTGHREEFGQETLGLIGVAVFFAISGFLVSRSWSFQPTLRAFVVKRGLRLYPALVVVLLVTVFVLGPIVTTLSTSSYLRAPETRGYFLHNAVLQTRYELPHVFGSVPYRGVVNGSLWTLPVEVKCYLFVAALGLVGLIGRRPWAVGAFALGGLALTVGVIQSNVPLGETLADLPGGHTNGLILFCVFAWSSLLFTLRHRIPLNFSYVAAALVLWALTIPLTQHRFATALLLPYGVIGFAYLVDPRPIKRLLGDRDLSYGTYLMAFPVQQVVAQVLDPGPLVMVAVSAPVTLLLAAFSWKLVEQPALRLKSRFGARSSALERALPGSAATLG
jgi:peptidoglycan/LPS O-acetylase OafA/YrhL